LLLSSAGIEHIASFEAPKPLQQISPSGKKINGDSSSQKLAAADVSFAPLNALVDKISDKADAHYDGLLKEAFNLRNELMRRCQVNLLQDEAFKQAKRSVQSQQLPLMLPAPSEQRVRTSTKRKSSEVEKEIESTVSPKGAKTSRKKLIKTAAKKPSAKRVKAIEVIPDPPILEVEPLDKDLEDATTLSELTRKVDDQKQVLSGLIEAQEALEAEDQALAKKYKEAKKFAKLAASLQAKTQADDATKLAATFKAKSEAEEAERRRLEAEEEKKRQADKAEEERVAEITKRLEATKKAQVEQKRQQELEMRRKEKEEKKQKEQKKEEKNIEIEVTEESKVGQIASREENLTKTAVVAPMVSMQPVVQPAVKVKPLIEATVPSIEAVAPLVSMFLPRLLSFLGSSFSDFFSSYFRLQVRRKVLRILTNF
jgi:hypothetical protein